MIEFTTYIMVTGSLLLASLLLQTQGKVLHKKKMYQASTSLFIVGTVISKVSVAFSAMVCFVLLINFIKVL